MTQGGERETERERQRASSVHVSVCGTLPTTSEYRQVIVPQLTSFSLASISLSLCVMFTFGLFDSVSTVFFSCSFLRNLHNRFV